MKTLIKLSLVIIFLTTTSSFGQNTEYSSIEEVKKLNVELFERIGFDDDQINYVCRIIYSVQKRSGYLAEPNYVSDSGISITQERLDKQFKSMFLRVLSEEDYKKFISVKHKLK